MTHIRVISNIAYVYMPKEQRKKLDTRVEKCIPIGYSHALKGYKCYNPQTREVRVLCTHNVGEGTPQEPCNPIHVYQVHDTSLCIHNEGSLVTWDGKLHKSILGCQVARSHGGRTVGISCKWNLELSWPTQTFQADRMLSVAKITMVCVVLAIAVAKGRHLH